MTGVIYLFVDDVPANVKLLEAKLTNEHLRRDYRQEMAMSA